MKTFFRFSIILISAFLAGTGLAVAVDLAFDAHPDEHHIVNGRYSRVTISGGAVEYRSTRSDNNFSSPVIRYDLATGRWGLYVTRRTTGVQEMIARTATVSSVDVTTRTWSLYNYVGVGPVYVIPPVKVYETIDQYTSCNNCSWTSPRTWSSGIVPRAYDHVIINGNITIDVPVKCSNLEIWTGTTASPVKSLSGRVESSKIIILGNLRRQRGTLFDVTEVEFAGNVRQTIESSNVPSISLYSLRIRINNPRGIQLNSPFRFFGRGVKSEMIFVKGHVYLGEFDLTAENISDADEFRFVITNGSGMLDFLQRSPSETLLQRFPVGPSIDRYTPMLVLFGSGNRAFSAMRGKASYNPSIFPPDDQVHIVYSIDHGKAVTSTGTPLSWVYQFQWDASDATAGFDFSYPLTVGKWNGTTWTTVAEGGRATGANPYKLLFTTRSAGLTNFGIGMAHKRIGGRTGAEESAGEAQSEKQPADFFTFPNPAPSSGFHVSVSDPENAQLRLQKLSGANVPITTQRDSENAVAVQPAQSLATGMYLLQVRENNTTRVHKVMVE